MDCARCVIDEVLAYFDFTFETQKCPFGPPYVTSEAVR